MWCRVFALHETAPEMDALLAYLKGTGYPAEANCQADDRGWFHLELTTSAGVYLVDRYLADEGIRDDLNTWAAWLEEHNPGLMQHIISSRQLITLRRHDRGAAPEARRFCHELARGLAQTSSGIYQIDGEGFFDATGNRLVAEESSA